MSDCGVVDADIGVHGKTTLRSNELMRMYIRTAYAQVLTLAYRTKISLEVNNKVL